MIGKRGTGDRMKRSRLRPGRLLLPGVLALATAACYDTLAPDIAAVCAPAVRVHGVTYTPGEGVVPEGFTPSAAYATVAARKACEDTFVQHPGTIPSSGPDTEGNGSAGTFGLSEGESNALPAGTPLYPIDGFQTTERLAVRTGGDWAVWTAYTGM